LQFNIRYEKVERPAPVGGTLVKNYFHCISPRSTTWRHAYSLQTPENI